MAGRLLIHHVCDMYLKASAAVGRSGHWRDGPWDGPDIGATVKDRPSACVLVEEAKAAAGAAVLVGRARWASIWLASICARGVQARASEAQGEHTNGRSCNGRLDSK